MENINIKGLGLSEDATKAVEAIVETLNQKANVEGIFTKNDAVALVEEKLNGLVSEEAMKSIKSDLEEVAGHVKALKEMPTVAAEAKGLYSRVYDALKSQESILATMKKTGSGSLNLDLKALTVGGSISGEANVLPEPQHIAGAISTTLGIAFITSFLNSFGATSESITWTEEKNDTGDAAFTGEGLLKAEIDFDLVNYKSEAKKITDFIKVSKEMLSDVPFIAMLITNKLMRRHDLKLEDGILNGTGGVEFDGITTVAAAFIAGAYAAAVSNPTTQDVIIAAITQVITASNDEFIPDTVFLNPADFGLMKVEKGTDGHYIIPPFQTDGGFNVEGVQVVAKTKIPADMFLIGDMTKANYGVLEAFNTQVGFVNDDFTKNLVTILGESRSHLFIAEEDKKAFVYDAISTSKAAILKV